MWTVTYLEGGRNVSVGFDTMQKACSFAIKTSRWAICTEVFSPKGRMEYVYLRGIRI